MTAQRKGPRRLPNLSGLRVMTDAEEEARRSARAELEDAVKRREAENAFIGCGIGKRFFGCRFDNYHPSTPGQADALGAIAAYTAGGGPERGDGILLAGAPDGGKTHLIAGILRQAANAGLSVGYMTMRWFFLETRSAISEKDQTEKALIERLQKPQVLAIDDLHFFESNYQYDMLWTLLDQRYANAKATIASTNLSIAEARELIDPRTWRRFVAEIIDVPKTDWNKIQ